MQPAAIQHPENTQILQRDCVMIRKLGCADLFGLQTQKHTDRHNHTGSYFIYNFQAKRSQKLLLTLFEDQAMQRQHKYVTKL